MSNFIKFNINSYVKIKLNEIGIRILEQRHNEMKAIINWDLGEFDLKLDKDGYYTMQMWEMMNTFGDFMFMHLNPPFEMVIMLEVENEKT